jgi:hypothetical protein
MRLYASQGAQADRVALLSESHDPSLHIVLHADADICVLMSHQDDAVIRDGDAPGFVFEAYVSSAHPKIIANFCDEEDAKIGFQWNGAFFPYHASEIDDVTPVDQSDLSHPGAIGAKVPERYEPYETLHAAWSNRDSKEIQKVLDAIRLGEEDQRDQQSADATAADNS